MYYSVLVWLARWELMLFVGGLAVTIAIKLLTRQINTQYLLHGTGKDGTKYFSPERVQLLIATIAI